jgi:hypothetical protein
MAKLYTVNDRNKARKWPIQLANGRVVILHANRWTESDEDLSDYVRSGFVKFRDTDLDVAVVAAPPVAVVAPVVAPVAAVVPRDPMSAFAAALNSAFAKPAPAAPVEAPATAEESLTVEADVKQGFTTALPEPVAQPIALDVAVDDTQEVYASMTRNALWVLATERDLVGSLDYRSTTKTQLVNLLVAHLEE